MNGRDIEAVISVTPGARFALKPTHGAMQVTELRNLERLDVRAWRCRGRQRGCNWTVMQVQSRQVCTVEDAEREVAATIARNKARVKDEARATAVVRRLRAFHIEAKRVGVKVLVEDTAGLDRVLDCVHGKLKDAARRKPPAPNPTRPHSAGDMLVTGKPHKL